MAQKTLFRIGWRYLLHHPWQSTLMILGITLGVAVVVAIDIANASASRAFDLSTEAVTGRATHLITAGPQGLDETLYTRLRLAGVVEKAAPIISEYVSSPQLGDRPLQLLGVDPFAEAPFRDYLSEPSEEDASLPQSNDLTIFLTHPGAVLISTNLASQYSIEPGDPLTIQIAGREHQAFLAGVLETSELTNASNRLSQRALDGIILADIATAQELTARLGIIDHIDLILTSDCKEFTSIDPSDSREACPIANQINAFLPLDAHLLPVEARSGAIREMTSAFRLNLSALSLLALVVGLFLIYNTITFSVIQRRPLFGALRCLGVTRAEVFTMVIIEASIAGLLGATLGIILGILLGQGAVHLVTQTINDLFFLVTVRGVQIPTQSLLKGAVLGVVATVLTAAPPAWEAASVPPRLALSRSDIESFAQRATRWSAVVGIILLLAATFTLWLPTSGLIISFIATFAIVIGFAMLSPLTTKKLMVAAVFPLGGLWGSLGRMAPRNVSNALSRTSIAIAALMVAVAVTIGVSLMISSFRHTVTTWLDQTLLGDIYLTAPGLIANQPSAVLDPLVVQLLETWPDIDRLDVIRTVIVDSPQGPIQLSATNNPSLAQERIFLSGGESLDEIQNEFEDGAIFISEPLANRLNLFHKDAHLTLFTSQGPRDFRVAGIFYDYASTQGTVTIEVETYRTYWQDDSLTGIAVRLPRGIDSDQLAVELGEALGPIQNLVIRPNQALRADVMEVFDRTFAITGALQLLATLVAFIGILSALLSLHLERYRALGNLRAVGLTVRQLWGLIMVESGLMGIVAGILAMPTGISLAVILIYIINRRSFGWTLQMQIEPAPFLQALLVSVIAGLLAGIYPAWKMGKTVTAEALRSE